MKDSIHYAPHYFLEPSHPITVNLVGCGGNGSQALTKLALLHTTLKKLNHAGLFVRVFDPDTVQEPNLGRQMFYEADLGHHKSTVLVSRVNRAFGTNWESHTHRYDKGNYLYADSHMAANILITCVDSGKSRKLIGEQQKEFINNQAQNRIMPYARCFYWLDYGNGKNSGQVVLGTLTNIIQPKSKLSTIHELPTILDLYPNIDEMDLVSNEPSCSTEEALLKQDLFTNCMLVPFGMQLLWNLLRNGRITEQGAFVNMATLKSTPVKISA